MGLNEAVCFKREVCIRCHQSQRVHNSRFYSKPLPLLPLILPDTKHQMICTDPPFPSEERLAHVSVVRQVDQRQREMTSVQRAISGISYSHQCPGSDVRPQLTMTPLGRVFSISSMHYVNELGTRGATVQKLSSKRKVAGSIPDEVIVFFN
jgi:hypothetical protein